MMASPAPGARSPCFNSWPHDAERQLFRTRVIIPAFREGWPGFFLVTQQLFIGLGPPVMPSVHTTRTYAPDVLPALIGSAVACLVLLAVLAVSGRVFQTLAR